MDCSTDAIECMVTDPVPGQAAVKGFGALCLPLEEVRNTRLINRVPLAASTYVLASQPEHTTLIHASLSVALSSGESRWELAAAEHCRWRPPRAHDAVHLADREREL